VSEKVVDDRVMTVIRNISNVSEEFQDNTVEPFYLSLKMPWTSGHLSIRRQ